MAERIAKHLQPVRLYYVGGFVAENPWITAAGKNYRCPPVGEFIEVPRHIAERLERRNRTPQGVSVFTTDKRMADAIIAARQQQANPPSVAERELSREELLEKLAALDAETKEENTKTRRNRAEDKEVA